MTDLTTLGRTETAGLTGRERREVVVKHEAVTVFTGKRIDDLFITPRTQRGDDDCLGFPAREQRRAVRSRQHPDTNVDWSNGARIATVYAWLAIEDTTANNPRFDVEKDVLEIIVED